MSILEIFLSMCGGYRPEETGKIVLLLIQRKQDNPERENLNLRQHLNKIWLSTPSKLTEAKDV